VIPDAGEVDLSSPLPISGSAHGQELKELTLANVYFDFLASPAVLDIYSTEDKKLKAKNEFSPS
jgi:hypothetical protein